jgi:hypothetical protein
LVKHFVFKYSGVRYVYRKGSYKVKKENPKKKKIICCLFKDEKRALGEDKKIVVFFNTRDIGYMDIVDALRQGRWRRFV